MKRYVQEGIEDMKLLPGKAYWVKTISPSHGIPVVAIVLIRKRDTREGRYSFYRLGTEIPAHFLDEDIVDFQEIINPFPEATCLD
jgi:hypothetical protein